MSKDVENYVNSLFKDYEQTSALQEFKEEIMSNLYARIDDLEKTDQISKVRLRKPFLN